MLATIAASIVRKYDLQSCIHTGGPASEDLPTSGCGNRRTSLAAFLSFTGVAAVVFAPASLDADTIAWTNWTAATIGSPTAGSATGTIATSPTPISVTYGGEVSSDTVVGAGPTPAGYPSWTPASTFSGGTIGNPPTYGDIIGITGGSGTGTDTVSFSQPVTNPVMAIWSLGWFFNAEFVFTLNEPFTIESGGPSTEYGGTAIHTDPSFATILVGNECNGTIQFNGTFTSISWTTPLFEHWYGFTVGVAVPEPSTIGLATVGVLSLIALRKRRRCCPPRPRPAAAVAASHGANECYRLVCH